MADITVHLDINAWLGTKNISVYANDTLLGRLRLVVDDEEEGTAGWILDDMYGPMSDLGLLLGRIVSKVNGGTGKEWRAALREWEASLTDAEWNATIAATHAEQINLSVHHAMHAAQKAMEDVSHLEPRSAAACATLSTLAEVTQELEAAATALGHPYAPEQSLAVSSAIHRPRSEKRLRDIQERMLAEQEAEQPGDGDNRQC